MLISTFGYSQTLNFTKANPQPNLMAVYSESEAFAIGDSDGDGDKNLACQFQSQACVHFCSKSRY
jgi:hypothetical protein